MCVSLINYFVEYDESDGNVSGEPPPDYNYSATKKDIHTINEQRRRDMIKVSTFTVIRGLVHVQ